MMSCIRRILSSLPGSHIDAGARRVQDAGGRAGLVVVLVARPSPATDALVRSLRGYQHLRVCIATRERIIERGSFPGNEPPSVVLIDQAAGFEPSLLGGHDRTA